jgi:RNA polymerase sigma factor (sigma-70 family)
VSGGAGARDVEPLLRALAPRVLGALARRHPRDFDACEDAVQEALLAGAQQWPAEGVPDDPRAWLLAVAGRRLVDGWRSESARRAREEAEAVAAAPLVGGSGVGEGAGGPGLGLGLGPSGDADPEDDSLALLVLCCHAALSPPSQIALTLRAVGGLTTTEIASAFLVPEATMAQRISRAKATIRTAGGRFTMPSPGSDEHAAALRAVLHVLYLMFNEGYAATSGPVLARVELTTEAIRLTRLVYALLPGDGEVTGLLALMLLTDARRPARTSADGTLVPLTDQDRSLWTRAEIDEGVALVTAALAGAPLGPYQLQAAIAAIHAEAPDADATDWPQIVALYRLLMRLDPTNPMISLNHAVAVAMADGPAAGLALVDEVVALLPTSHRPIAVRAHLLELAGEADAAIDAYEDAARRTTSLPERRYLESRAATLRAR